MTTITVSVANGLALVGVTGAIVRGDNSNHLAEVLEWLRECGENRVTLHAAGVSAVDIDGLVAIMDAHVAVKEVGGHLVIRAPSRALRLALRRTGLDTVLVIVEGPESGPSHRAA
jgi:anti-anti-sigma regulatory factor